MVVLHDRVETELAKLGYRKEHRRFQTHLTIGRVRGGGRASPNWATGSSSTPIFMAGRMTVEKLTVFASTLTAAGPNPLKLGPAGRAEDFVDGAGGGQRAGENGQLLDSHPTGHEIGVLLEPVAQFGDARPAAADPADRQVRWNRRCSLRYPSLASSVSTAVVQDRPFPPCLRRRPSQTVRGPARTLGNAPAPRSSSSNGPDFGRSLNDRSAHLDDNLAHARRRGIFSVMCKLCGSTHLTAAAVRRLRRSVLPPGAHRPAEFDRHKRAKRLFHDIRLRRD